VAHCQPYTDDRFVIGIEIYSSGDWTARDMMACAFLVSLGAFSVYGVSLVSFIFATISLVGNEPRYVFALRQGANSRLFRRNPESTLNVLV
jgi:hypothetical protein